MLEFFEPERMAIIGVSDATLSLGRIVFQNAFRLGFKGDVFGVGSFSDSRYEAHMVRSISELPEDVDLAVVLTPADTLPKILAQCGGKGIHRVVIESAGFSEYGGSKKSLEEKIIRTARAHSIRLMGPNCVGTINAARGLFLPFAAVKDLSTPGEISLISQSGGVGTHFFLRLAEEGLGLAKFASVGNKLDLDEVDFLDYMIRDPDTSIIGMYLESISRGKILLELMRQSSKAIVILKSNRTAGSAVAARSHTAALSSDDDVVDAAIRQAGAIRVRTASEMIDTLKILSLPPMKGNRVAVLSRSGGHAVVTVDACIAAGFTLAEFPETFLESLSELYPSRVITRQNPLDLGEVFDYPVFAKIAAKTLELDQVDGLIFNHIYVAGIESEPSRIFLNEIKKLQQKFAKPIVVTLATELAEVTQSARLVSFPVFSDPESAVTALKRSAAFAQYRANARGLKIGKTQLKHFDALPVFENASPSLPETFELLRQWNMPVAPYRFVTEASDAPDSALELGYPLAVKLVSQKASHKTDVGGVALNVVDGNELTEVLDAMSQNAKVHLGPNQVQGFCLQPMVDQGIEVIVGGRKDPQFGSVVMLGLGGVFVELIQDRSLRVAPVTVREAKAMIHDLRGKDIFDGFRGSPSLDVIALARLIVDLSQILAQSDEIVEIDLNPVKVLPQGVQILDARLMVNTVDRVPY